METNQSSYFELLSSKGHGLIYLHDGGSKFRDRVDIEAWGWGVMWSPGALGKTWAQGGEGGGAAGDWMLLSHRLSREGLQGADTSFTCEHTGKLFRFIIHRFVTYRCITIN